MKKYKILYLTYHPEIGGGEIVLLSLLSKLNPKRFQPIVVVTRKGQLQKRLTELNIKTHILPLSGYLIRTFFVPGASPAGIFHFLKLAKKIKPNLIHLNHLNLAIYAGIAGKLLKTPVVATAHGPWDGIYFYQDIVNSLFADKILANTPKVAKALTKRKILNSKKVEVAPFGIDTNLFKPQNKNLAKKEFGLSPKNLVVTIVGRLDPEKDHLTFLQAAKEISAQVPNVRFLIVGSKLGDFSAKNSDYGSQINRFLSQNPNLAKKVIFTGFINNMPKVYAATDVLVSSSLGESFGLALAEAAACGLPVISTNFGGQHLIVRDGTTGFLVPSENPKTMAAKILYLAKNPKLRSQFGRQAKQLILEKFTLKKYLAEVEKVYLELLESKKN